MTISLRLEVRSTRLGGRFRQLCCAAQHRLRMRGDVLPVVVAYFPCCILHRQPKSAESVTIVATSPYPYDCERY
jgi:hypothetical protein